MRFRCGFVVVSVNEFVSWFYHVLRYLSALYIVWSLMRRRDTMCNVLKHCKIRFGLLNTCTVYLKSLSVIIISTIIIIIIISSICTTYILFITIYLNPVYKYEYSRVPIVKASANSLDQNEMPANALWHSYYGFDKKLRSFQSILFDNATVIMIVLYLLWRRILHVAAPLV